MSSPYRLIAVAACLGLLLAACGGDPLAVPESGNPDLPGDPGTGPSFVVSPQEMFESRVGEPVELVARGRYDAEPMPEALSVSSVPCESGTRLQETWSFGDEDDDDAVDASWDQASRPRLVSVEGEQPDADLDDVGRLQVTDESLRLSLVSDRPSCALVVFYLDENSNGMLDLTGEDFPTEPYGVGQVTWLEIPEN